MDIIKPLQVRGVNEATLSLYFDSGSPYTFVDVDAAGRLGGMLPLPEPEPFSGLGNGQFYATHIIHIKVKLLDIWCRHLTYVATKGILAPGEDILIGHDFMQRYRIGLDMERGELVLDRDALLRAQKVHYVKIGRSA